MRRTSTLVFGDILVRTVCLLHMVVKGSSAALRISLEMMARIAVHVLTDE
jgi:hypothetical protein